MRQRWPVAPRSIALEQHAASTQRPCRTAGDGLQHSQPAPYLVLLLRDGAPEALQLRQAVKPALQLQGAFGGTNAALGGSSEAGEVWHWHSSLLRSLLTQFVVGSFCCRSLQDRVMPGTPPHIQLACRLKG